MKQLVILMLFFFGAKVNAQHLFPIQYNDCNTDVFSLEKDSAIVNIDLTVMEGVVVDILQVDIRKKTIKGTFTVQILVDLEGKSCLLSVENKTNLDDKDFLYLKDNVDAHLRWNKPPEKVAVIFSFNLDGKKPEIQRWGFDMQKGLHKIDNYKK